MKINTLCIFGTCSELIKMAPIIQRLNQDSRFHNHIALIDQGHQGIGALFELFEINPDYQWHDLGDPNNTISFIANILTCLAELFSEFRPHYVLVAGGSITALSAAMAAYYGHIPIGHIEAGLRIGQNDDWQWPQEVNRKVIGDLANVHFAPTFLARQNLLREGVASDAIDVTGSATMDALFDMVMHIQQNAALQTQLSQQFSYLHASRRMILVAATQSDNLEHQLHPLCQALVRIAQAFPGVDIVYAVDLNANTRPILQADFAEINNIFLMSAMDYAAFVYLMQQSYLIITDSGGVQEEGPALGKPVLLLRDHTERSEAIESGTVVLVGTDPEKIVLETTRLLKNHSHYQQMSQSISPYGDGKAAVRIVEILAKHSLKQTNRQCQQHPEDMIPEVE
jgi:UDP-N-acetylglucosamine 2-epimerase (non-hydrolysing)